MKKITNKTLINWDSINEDMESTEYKKEIPKQYEEEIANLFNEKEVIFDNIYYFLSDCKFQYYFHFVLDGEEHQIHVILENHISTYETDVFIESLKRAILQFNILRNN